jgi:effector-binding domain-containing protein
MTISKFSLLTRLSQKALRLYDQKGLLTPAIKDFVTGYRYYSPAQIERGVTIKYLASLGFALADIATILDASSKKNTGLVQDLFGEKLKEVQSEIQRLKRVENLLLGIKDLDSLFPNTTEPVIKQIPEIRVISRREFGTYSQTIGSLITDIYREIHRKENMENFVTITGPSIFIAHDDEYKEENADIEVAVPISGRITVADRFTVKNLEGGEFLSTIYTGPYEGVGEGHDALTHYCVKQGFTVCGHAREMYLNSPQEKSPQELMTEIQTPILRR